MGQILGGTVGMYISRKYTMCFALLGMAFSTFFFVWMFYLITHFGSGSQLALNCGFYGFKLFVAVAFLLIYVYAMKCTRPGLDQQVEHCVWQSVVLVPLCLR